VNMVALPDGDLYAGLGIRSKRLDFWKKAYVEKVLDCVGMIRFTADRGGLHSDRDSKNLLRNELPPPAITTPGQGCLACRVSDRAALSKAEGAGFQGRSQTRISEETMW